MMVVTDLLEMEVSHNFCLLLPGATMKIDGNSSGQNMRVISSFLQKSFIVLFLLMMIYEVLFLAEGSGRVGLTCSALIVFIF